MNLLVKPTSGKSLYITAFAVLLLLSFLTCYYCTRDLHWASEPDFDRDISFVQGMLDGNYGKDPSYKGEHLWYTPLLFTTEALIVKVTGLPIHDVVTRSGVYLNILGPVFFFVLLWFFLGAPVALAGSLSFLFLATGNIIGSEAATYSPWLFPVNFVQFLFYISLLVCYKAYASQKYTWFILLGICLGVTFLGHAAPAIIAILILIVLHARLIFTALRNKGYGNIRRLLTQGVAVFIPFVLFSLPLTWFVGGKYHFHIINRYPSQFTEGIFYVSNWKEMIKENLSIGFIIALTGFIWFYLRFPKGWIRKILLSWVLVTVVMYLYSTAAYIAERQYGILLPVTVPSFHYFFYFKAAQSLFFGVGLVALVRLIATKRYFDILTVSVIVIWTLAYYSVYKNRLDFVKFRAEALVKEKDTDKLGIYHYLVGHIPENKVILCPEELSLHPVMPSARKMVSTGFTFSNPYVDFTKREAARQDMLSYLRTGSPASAKSLFDEYDVSYVVLPANYNIFLMLKPVYSNSSYAIYSYK